MAKLSSKKVKQVAFAAGTAALGFVAINWLISLSSKLFGTNDNIVSKLISGNF